MTKENSEGAIPIKKSDSNTHIRAKNFCDKFAIDYSKSHRHRLRKDAQSSLLYFELGQEEEDTEDDSGEIAATAT